MLLFFAAFAVSVLLMVHPVSALRRNERTVEKLLLSSRSQSEGCCVILVTMDNIVLLPEKPQDIAGYTILLRVSGLRYELVARPKEYGRSGLVSFYVTEQHVLRAQVEPRN
jgi:hypothetical protein